MKAFYSDHVVLHLPLGHRFPAEKYRLLREQIVREGLLRTDEILPAEPATQAQLLRVHSANYLERLAQGRMTEREMRRIGFPWSPALIERSRRSVGATLAASHTALAETVGINLGGGTHHAHTDFGAGFCVFNDVAVAARELLAQGQVERILIVDCDGHQGDGTAAIFADESSVFTFSIHGQSNFPFRKAKSDLDIGLPDGCNDQAYLSALEAGLAQAFEDSDPQFVFYLAGADPFREDTFGRMRLTKAGLAARDRLVFGACADLGLPITVTMAGGYAARIEDTVGIHAETVLLAAQYFAAAGSSHPARHDTLGHLPPSPGCSQGG